MEGLLFILIVFVLVMVFMLMNKINRVESKIDRISDHLFDGKVSVPPSQKTVSPPSPQPVAPPAPVTPDPIIEQKRKAEEGRKIANQEKTLAVIAAERKKKEKPKKPPRPSFMERNPDLEKFIGENLLSKIGIVIFVIGMGFLVKLGIDSNVITEGMRVAIGILIGGGMIGLAHYLRKTFANFSSILIGGALSVLYFTIALAFHEYQLIPQTAAFIIMVLITAFGVLLSIAYDRKELAVLAMIGGFGTPFFISTGSGNFGVLLGYILMLDIGMLTLVYFKKWNIINYLTYGFTYILFSGVFYSKFVGNEEATRIPLFLYLTSYYLIFFLMTIIYNVKRNEKFKSAEVGMLLSNSAIYFGFGLGLLSGFKDGLYSGLFTTLIALFNFGFTFVLYRRKNIDKNLLYLLIGLVLTFISLIGPIQLKGNYITLFWAFESVLLLWLSQKSGIKLMRAASILVTLLMIVSLFMDWQAGYFPTGEYVVLGVLLNKIFITSFISMGALLAQVFLQKEAQEKIEVKNQTFIWKRTYVEVLFVLVAYIGIFTELNYQFLRFEFVDSLRIILLGIYNFTFVGLLLIAGRFKQSNLLDKVTFVLSIAVVVSYLTIYLSQATEAREMYLRATESVSTGFFWHYLLLAFFIAIVIHFYRGIYLKHTFKSDFGTKALWVLAFIGIYTVSAEIGHIAVLIHYTPELSAGETYDMVLKSVYPVIWAFSALGMMILGMKYKLKVLRLASLIIFSVTILKLFFYDLAGNSTGKIISFILLGVILLVISFLYQKLKFIIQDDEQKKD